MPESSMKQFIRLMKYLKGKEKEFTLSVIFIILVAYTSGVIPVLIRDAIDKGVISKSLGKAIYYSMIIIIVAIINGVLSFIGRILLVKSSQHAVYKIRVEAFNSILRQGMEFFNKTMTGQLISRITNDAERITGFLSFRLRMLVYSIFLIIISLWYMLGMNSMLAGIALITIIATLGVNYTYARKIRPIYNEIRHQTGVLASISSGTLMGIRTVKALGSEEKVFEKFGGENEKLYGLNIRATRISAFYGNSPFLILGMAMSSMLFYGGRAIEANALTVGELVAFLTYMLTLMWPLRALGFIIGDIQRSLAAATRLFEIIDSAPPASEYSGGIKVESIRGEIVVENVWLTYHTGKTALKGVSLYVKPGEKILIMGPPGSGKSTLLKLIAGIYKPDKGRVLIDNIPLDSIRREDLRRIVAYIPQEPFIFNRSIYENIALWDPNVKEADVIKAAKLAKIHDFIISLQDGYRTIVGERGITLSGGQRQRIALARALARNPQIILMDDPVSNLDAETEKALVRDLKDALAGKTVIMVSQRPSLASIADRVIVMSDGRIIWEGPPSELRINLRSRLLVGKGERN